jgi:hypothetical protein
LFSSNAGQKDAENRLREEILRFERATMNEPGGKLKHPSGWFAAGREVSRALALLSDGAFKLYIHLCLKADRRTGLLGADQGDLVKAVGKSRRSIVTYLEELRERGVCRIQPAANQHSPGEIEICDAFWPYEKAAQLPRTSAVMDYIEQIRRLLQARSCVENPFTAADEKLGAALLQRKIPIEDVENGVLLGCARKYVALLNGKNEGLIVSFSYFQKVIEEAQKLQMPPDYWRYLRIRLTRLEQQWTGRGSAAVAPVKGRRWELP